jgi:hypothetical protein
MGTRDVRDAVARHAVRVKAREARVGVGSAPDGGVVEAVLGAMSEGETLSEAAADVGVTPSLVRRWIASEPGWMAAYQHAKRLQAQAWAEEAIQVARESTNQSATKDRLLVDTLKWAAAKASPGEFGDKQTVEHQGQQQLTVRVVEETPGMHQQRAADRGGLTQSAVDGVVSALTLGGGTTRTLSSGSSAE